MRREFAHKRPLFTIAFSLLGMSALIVGCSSGGTSGNGAAPAGHSGSCAKQGAPIVIGTVGTQSGQAAQYEKDGPLAIQAWVDMMNASGGVNCHPIKYMIEDDDGDPSQNLSLVQQLVQQDHAVAFVGMDGAATMQASETYLAQQNIPVIGGDTAWDFYYSHPNFFPQVAMGNANLVALADYAESYAKSKGFKKVGVITCQEVPTCTTITKTYPASFAEAGLDLAYNGAAPFTTTDYTAQCLAAKKAGVQLLLINTANAGNQAIANSCAKIGYSPQYLTSQSTSDPTMAQNPNLSGLLIPLDSAPWFDTSIASINEYHEALSKYGNGEQPSGPGAVGWASALLLGAGLAGIPAGSDPSSQLILNTLYKIKDDTLGGMIGPVTYTAGHDAPRVLCLFPAQIENGQFVSISNGKAVCPST
jgi:branched-chain amino acid transport system substrate-binding protein